MSEALQRIQTPFGMMTWDEQLGWWESAPLPLPIFGGAPARIAVDFEISDDPSAPFATDVVEDAHSFLALGPEALSAIGGHVWADYQRIKEVWEDCPIIERSHLWKHVTPNGLTIERRDKDGLPYVNIECNCDWEPEHGLQLVLQNGSRWVRVSGYSGHLTEGEAYDCDALDEWMSDFDATLPLRSFEEVLSVVEKERRRARR